MPLAERKKLINSKLKNISVNKQLVLLKMPKSSYYYRAQRSIRKVYQDQVIKEKSMEIYKEYPFYGVPRTTKLLQKMGYKINYKRVNHLRREMGLQTIYPRPRFNTSVLCEEHEKFPYLLKGLKIVRPNLWTTDISYMAVKGGRAFVIAIIDLFSRKVMAYQVVNTVDTEHCVEVLKTAIRLHGRTGLHETIPCLP